MKQKRSRLAAQFFQAVGEGGESVLVRQAYVAFIRSLRREQSARRTIQAYEQRLQRFVALYGDLDLNLLTADHVDEWLDEYIDRDRRYVDHPTRPPVSGELSSATISGLIQSIKRFINWCDVRYEEDIHWRRPPTAHLKRPKRPPKSRRENGAMRPDDFLAMLAAAREKRRDFAMLAFMGDTAVRVGEAASLCIRDLDLDGCQAEVHGKTGPREVDFTPATAAALCSWLEERPDVGHDAVWVSLHGVSRLRPLTTYGIYLVFKRLARRAGININGRWSPQSLRRMVGQLWADNGVNPERIQLKLGHADIKTTLNWYTFQDMDRVRETTRKLSLVSQFAADD